MTIKNGSSYRIGFTYNLDIVGKGVTSVKVVNKGHFKLLLQLPDGKEEWFNYDQLTSTKKVYSAVKTVENPKTETPIVAKVESPKAKKVAVVKKLTSIATVKSVEVAPSEIRDNNFWQNQYGYFMHELKKGLIAKGYDPKIKSWSPKEVRELVLQNIKSQNG